VNPMAIDLTKCIYVKKTDTYITPKGIITFSAVSKKWKQKDKKDDDGQFAVSLIVPPESDLSVLKEAAAAAAKEKFGSKAKGIRSPFLDAAEKLDSDYVLEGFDPEGWIMLRANTYQQRPNVIFGNGVTVPEDELADEVYNGRWARMSVRPKAYDQEGNKGVKFYLHNVQVLDEGDKWPSGGGRTNAEDEFEAVDVESSVKGEATTKSSDSVFD
jgi:hypothetical protein